VSIYFSKTYKTRSNLLRKRAMGVLKRGKRIKWVLHLSHVSLVARSKSNKEIGEKSEKAPSLKRPPSHNGLSQAAHNLNAL